MPRHLQRRAPNQQLGRTQVGKAPARFRSLLISRLPREIRQVKASENALDRKETLGRRSACNVLLVQAKLSLQMRDETGERGRLRLWRASTTRGAAKLDP